jgi:MFS family permease
LLSQRSTDSDDSSAEVDERKRTPDGKIVLEPQPESTFNDPLNWPLWKRTVALFVLGFYCMVGGGMAPLLAAGFNDVAQTYDVAVEKVALTTGFYMLGLGLGGVAMVPTAIKFGKRPVYLITAVMMIGTSIWCATSPTYPSLVAARIAQGVAVSPVEVLASATVSELFFLHERAFRLGIYTLLLLSGKNLMPLFSAIIIQAAGWRWVFW